MLSFENMGTLQNFLFLRCGILYFWDVLFSHKHLSFLKSLLEFSICICSCVQACTHYMFACGVWKSSPSNPDIPLSAATESHYLTAQRWHKEGLLNFGWGWILEMPGSHYNSTASSPKKKKKVLHLKSMVIWILNVYMYYWVKNLSYLNI